MYVGGVQQVSVINLATTADVKDLVMSILAAGDISGEPAYNINNNRTYITAFGPDELLRINP